MIIFALVKKLFSSITILITLSLVGIIFMQISWLKNLIALREDQIKQKIDDVCQNLSYELGRMRDQYISSANTDLRGLFSQKNFLDPFGSLTIGNKISSGDLEKMISREFNKAGLEKMKYEYAIVSGQLLSKNPVFEKQSAKFWDAFMDTVHNYTPDYKLIRSQPGSPSESITSDEALIITSLNWKNFVKRTLIWRILLALSFTIIIVAAFYLTVYTMLRQKKLSDIKNDFINNMTHEFKTPIATISLAVDALKNERVLSDREKLSYFSGIIKEENQRMNKQVETILKASQFEKQEADIELSPLSVHDVIGNVVDNFQLQLHDKGGDAQLMLNAKNDIIRADEVHFTNLVNNLIDNAVKYSKENVPIQLKISTSNAGGNIIIKFSDNGIGMARDTQKRIFEKFYRAHTGNLHNVKGFGLGLNYVKSVVDSHSGSVKVESALGKGSVFTVEFPLSKS
ncbi:MAG TPA: HAMP domain-containing sensor histidine kinase [Niabella sp.]|nr:HAMP domain-containing sensor histidine kinase [Niabella sp.]HRB27391.1 HAMP domain-containing sensor histidine kinase [Niabella sp.]HRB61154.1 HAMP domain-containing sensor histidine kinase [Niabella sp.]